MYAGKAAITQNPGALKRYIKFLQIKSVKTLNSYEQ